MSRRFDGTTKDLIRDYAQKGSIMTNEQDLASAKAQMLRTDAQQSEQPPLVMWQVGKIKDMNREFDIAFWQAQSATARLRAGWEMVEFYHKLKGSTDELRLHRAVESLQRKRG
jgi:hypothetical protein